MGTWLSEDAYAASLAGLPGLRPGRLRRLIGLGNGVPSDAWRIVAEGRMPADAYAREVRSRWRAGVRDPAPAEVIERYRRTGVRVLVPGMGGYPKRLAEDPEAPAVLFAAGNLEALDGPTVGVVGTRSATGYGRDVAATFGRRLARAGVAVVSGLAAGIDVAAHRGVLSAGAEGTPPVAVVGTGIDVVYPVSSAPVWEGVRRAGVIVSEAPLGAPASAWRFPYRNRIMAALSDVVVVVESHEKGGALITAGLAADRGRAVMAVPGPVTSAASGGSNSLIADGCLIARDVTDVLVCVGLAGGGVPAGGAHSGAGRKTRPRPTPEDRQVLAAIDPAPTTLEQVMVRTGRSPGELVLALDRLADTGWVRSGAGWWERLCPAA